MVKLRAILLIISPIIVVGCDTTKPFSRLRLQTEQCNEAQTEQVRWSVAFMRAAAKSDAFRACLRMATLHGESIVTRQEARTVGPYVPCKPFSWPFFVTNQDLLEPLFVYEYPQLAYEAALRIALSQNRLLVRCTNNAEFSSFTLLDYGYGHERTEEVNLGGEIFMKRPDHERNTRHDARFSIYDPSYPVDEIAGIIYHEMLHSHGFEHGDSKTGCGYASYECRDAISGGGESASCRFNSLNEIGEACMSEIVEVSISFCRMPCPDVRMVPIVDRLPTRPGDVVPCTCITP